MCGQKPTFAYLLLIPLLFVLPDLATAQGTVMGRVIDGQSGRALPTVQIFIPDSGLGTITRGDGTYELVNVPAGNQTVQAQGLGFQSVTVTVAVTAGESSVADFSMTRQALALDEVVVTGTAGGTQRRAVGNVVERLNVAAISEVSPATSIEELLGGRVPGMVALPSGGAGVGNQASSIRIRGSSSGALSNDPIIFIDGIRINSDQQNRSTAGATSRLNDINPADIESIEVIKGPAAATLYGTEASNGVIQITTKRGIVAAPSFEASVELGANWFPDPMGTIPVKYGRHPTTGEIISHHPYETEREFLGRDLFQYGPIQRYSLAVRGGTDLVRYFVSGNHAYQEGVFDFNSDQSTSGRISLSLLATDKLNLNFNGSYMKGETRPFNFWGTMANGRPNSVEALTGRPDPRRGWNGPPPDVVRNDGSNVIDVDRSSFSMEIRHETFEWLTNRVVFGVDRTDQTQTIIALKNPSDPFNRVANREGRVSVDNNKSQITTVDYAGTATLGLTNQLSSATSWGLQYYDRTNDRLFARGDDFATPALTTVSAAARKLAAGEFLQNATVGIYLQEQLDWERRIFLTAAIRADDNSAFGSEFSFATYPKVSATWVLHEEPFWADVPYVGEFRLRGAWGAAGLQPDAFAATRLYETRTGPGDAPVVYPSAFGNPELGPERGEEIEIGFDASFLQGRADIQFTQYWKTTKDAIVATPMAPSTGFQGVQFLNIGQVSNWGTEVALGMEILTAAPVRWNAQLNIATMNNRVDDMGDLSLIPVRRAASHAVGYPLSSLFNFKVLSADFVSGNSGQVTNVMCDGGTGPDGRRQGGAPVPCSEAPLVFFAGGEPTWSINLSNTFTIGENVRLYALIDGRGGHRFSNDEVNGVHTTYTNTMASLEMTDPIFQGYRAVRRNPISYTDGAFFKLREIALNYSLPTSWAQRVGANRAALNIAARNLAILWQKQKYYDYGGVKVVDPELGFMPQFGFGGETRSGPSLHHAVVRFDVTF